MKNGFKVGSQLARPNPRTRPFGRRLLGCDRCHWQVCGLFWAVCSMHDDAAGSTAVTAAALWQSVIPKHSNRTYFFSHGGPGLSPGPPRLVSQTEQTDSVYTPATLQDKSAHCPSSQVPNTSDLLYCTVLFGDITALGSLLPMPA
jgi:hypothetical protein